MGKIAQVHLDPIGGIAGDMFVAAMADAFPEMVTGLVDELAKLGDGIRLLPHADASLHGLRFVVEKEGSPTPAHSHDEGGHDHLHVPYARIREQLDAAGLQPEVLRHALGLFDLLAAAESEVHGVSPDQVEFHEVGARDSIVDFVAAAYFIATVDADRWTCAPLPLGGGRVRTAHGVLPVPAPATTLLMKGLAVIDDGVSGERVTPTGAAIVRYVGKGVGDALHRVFVPDTRHVTPISTGHGFGTRTLPGMPNMLRVIAFEYATLGAPAADEEIATLQFEIDDQSAEDLAVALERIRATEGVLEAYQAAVYGKKGRVATQVQVLARLEAADRVADACLAQTTTLGLRITRVARRTLMRTPVEVQVPDTVRVKVTQRPAGNLTAKAEMDDVARQGGNRIEREDLRERAEHEALDKVASNEPDHDHD